MFKFYCAKCDQHSGPIFSSLVSKCQTCCKPCQYQCLVCKKTYTTHLSARFHLYAERFGLRKCPHCEERLPAANMSRHIKNVHTLVNPDNYLQCEKCGNKFKHRATLKQHRQYVCGNKDRLKCSHCKFGTRYEWQLSRHMLQEHTGDSTGKSYACGKCGKKYRRERCYRLHLKSNCRIQKSFECWSCDFQTDNEKTFFNHLATKHSRPPKK